MQILSDETWQQLTFGKVQTHGTLSVLPIMADLPSGPDYLTLSEALGAGSLVITEVTEGGSVPELVVINEGNLPVLLLDGEELSGAKQNRVVNTTILLKEHSKTVIPVSCVEHGRWNYSSQIFHDSGNVMSAHQRSHKGHAVSQSLASSGRRASDQGQVWDDVAEMANSFKVNSQTGAMRDVYAHVDYQLTEMLSAFSPQPEQRGIAVFIGENIVGVEYLSNPRAFAKVFDKLLRSYALDALRARHADATPAKPGEQTRLFINNIASSVVKSYAALGYGCEQRIEGKNVHGEALSLDDVLIHLTLLANETLDSSYKKSALPFSGCYWVQPAKLLAGCYPGASEARTSAQKLRSLLSVGVRAVINLMEPQETDYRGRPFRAYEDQLYRLACSQGVAMTCLRLPFPEQCVPTREAMRNILDFIDTYLEKDMPVYLHCRRGNGRTGLVVGCWLARHGLAHGDEALRMLQELRQQDPIAQSHSPENDLQCEMIRGWQVGE